MVEGTELWTLLHSGHGVWLRGASIYIFEVHVYALVCARFCGCVDAKGRRRRTEGGGGMEERSHSAAARRTHVIRGCLRRCWDDTGAGCWTLDAVAPRPRRVSGRRSESYPRLPGAFTVAGSYLVSHWTPFRKDPILEYRMDQNWIYIQSRRSVSMILSIHPSHTADVCTWSRECDFMTSEFYLRICNSYKLQN